MQIFQFFVLVGVLMCFLVFITKEISQTRLVIKQMETRKVANDKFHQECLEKLADPFLIFQYFETKRRKLPENLHNIMLGHCLADNYFAKSYIDSLDPTTGEADDYFKSKKRMLK